MNLPLENSLIGGLLWMKENWLENRWDHKDHVRSKIYPSIVNLLSGKFYAEDVDLLITWTHGRFELEVGMSPPGDMDNSKGWAAASKLAEIRQELIRIKSNDVTT